MAAAVDINAISTFTSVPTTAISTLLEAPTVELVTSLLQGIAAKFQEHEQLKAQKFRLSVELETAVRTNESKTKVLKTSVDKALAESSRLRVDLQTSETTRLKLESEIEQIRASSTNEASEVVALRSRVSSLEAANRDALAVLDSKTSAYDKLAEDLAAQHQKSVDLRRQVTALEQSIQAANSAAASTRFKESSLEQELDLLRRNNEWLETELKTKAAEQLKFRKEKGARISELQRLNEQYITEADFAKRSESSLRSRLDEQLQKFEDALTEIQQLKEARTQDAEGFRVELDSATRLAELQKASADTARQRADELSIALDETREEAANEIGRIRAEIETEYNDREAAEARVAELESTVEKLESELELARAQPTTPQRGVNGHAAVTPNRPATPSGIFSPASASRLKGNLSVTQIYTDYKKIEKELAREKRNNEQLSSSLDEMVRDLEANKPEIDELRADHAKLQSEMIEMSNLMDAANQERDSAVKETRKLQGQLESLLRESDILRQQLRDASSQIKVLLLEQHIRENGQPGTAEEMMEYERLARADEESLAGLSDTGRVISESLTTFRNTVQLQEQNTKILRMIRELGEQLESIEAREKDQTLQREREELETLRVKVNTYKDELRSMVAQSQSYIKERDMFRNMLTRKGQLPSHVDSSAFAQSMPLPAAGTPPRGLIESIQGGSVAGEDVDFAKLLRDVQSHFDSYRQESATDHSALKKQIDELSKRNSQLQSENSKALSQLSGANHRNEMLQANFNMLKGENAEIQKRSYTLMENATKQELRTQQAAEELVEVKGFLESARRETANLKAEKELSKTVQGRLSEDNEALRNERARLDQLNASLQNMMNEREQTDSETRRRLQAHSESLETELQTVRRQLNDEIEESKKAALRREYEHEQSQKRIDDLVTSLGSVREELVMIKTVRDHLQTRVDEMTVELRSAEERLEVLQNRPNSDQTANADEDETMAVSREQELAIEVSELKRDLELKISEVERANEQIETYKSISQSSEERLQELTETNEQYREETERVLEEKDNTIKDLQQRIEDINSELSTTNVELSKLRGEQSEYGRRLEEQKTILEAEIARLKEQEERNAEQAQFNLEATKAQAEIATEAQQNYENELVKHAEAAKTLQVVRSEANQLRLEIVDLRTQAESATTSLAQKEQSWSEIKEKYERELSDLKKRRDEVAQQNTILHGQLDNLMSQIAALQRDRAALADTESSDTVSPGLENLQEVIKYLRREKEIVDVQYHLSTQEAKRLRQQLDFTQSQLDETRLKLDQQRRAEADSERNALDHNKLMETLNELNLYRESSVTLRTEAKQAAAALAERTQRVNELTSEIEPLRIRISELENEAELRDGEMKLLQDNRDYWRQRTENILSKYDRVDPAELESLKEKLATIESERTEAVDAQQTLQSQIDSFPEQLEAQRQELRSRLGEQFKARSKELTGRIKDKQTELDAVIAEKANLQTELDTVKLQLETMKAEVSQGSAEVNGMQQAIAPDAESAAEASAENQSGRVLELETKIAELESSLAVKDEEITSIRTQADEHFKNREAELKGVLNKRLAEVKTNLQAEKDKALAELEEKLKSEHQAKMDALKAGQATATGEVSQATSEAVVSAPASADVLAKPAEGELPPLTEAQAKLLIQKNEVVRNLLRANIRKAVEKREETLRKELEATAAAAGDKSSPAQIEELERSFAAQKEALVKEMDEKFNNEKDTLVKQYEERLTREKQDLVIQQQEKLSNERMALSREADKKVADQVALAEKRLSVKLNMSENRARTAGAKLEVVKAAAEETPQKPVAEVWAIAKDTKAVAVNAQPKPGTVAAPPLARVASGIAENGVLPSLPSTDPASSPGQGDTHAISEPTGSQPQPAQPSQVQTQAPPSTLPKPTQNNHTGTGPAVLRQLQSGTARGAMRGGRGGAAGQQPAHPNPNSTEGQAQQATSRGSGIPRGTARGRGQGRGGNQNVQTSNLPQPTSQAQTSTGSPRGGGLNPQARQFNPQGSKRAREDGESSDGGIGKRIRGGGAGT